MTDARYPERWLSDRRVCRLSDAAHRLFVTALAWSVSNRSEGAIDSDDLHDMPRIDANAVNELVAAGLWVVDDGRWVITVFADSQTSVSLLEAAENARRFARERKARQRLRAAEARA